MFKNLIQNKWTMWSFKLIGVSVMIGFSYHVDNSLTRIEESSGAPSDSAILHLIFLELERIQNVPLSEFPPAIVLESSFWDSIPGLTIVHRETTKVELTVEPPMPWWRTDPRRPGIM